MSLTPPPTSVDESVGIARESSFGTTAAPSIFFHPVVNQFKRRPNRQAMAGATGGVSRFRYASGGGSRIFDGMNLINGPFGVHAEFDDIGHLFSAMWGAPSSGAVVDSSFTHTWTVPRTIPSATPDSLSFSRLTGLVDRRNLGSMPMKMTMRGTQGGIIMVSFEMVAQSGGDATVASTVGSFSTAPWMEFPDSKLRWHTAAGTATGSLTDQTAEKQMKSWEIVFDNNLRVEQAAGDGQRGPREFTYNGIRPVTLNVVRDWADQQFFDDMMDTTAENWFNSLEIAITSPQFVGAGSTPYSLAIYSGAAALLGEPSEFDGSEGVTPENLAWEFGDDTTNAVATVKLVNGTDGAGNPYGS